MTRFEEDEFQEAKPRPKGHIPYLPDREATFSEMRHWVSNAIGLPAAVRVDTVTRFGRDEDSAMTIMLSNDMELRCGQQKSIRTPSGFSAFFASASDGLCQPLYLNSPEVADVYIALCRLATLALEQDELSELRERLDGFVSLCEVVHGSLVPEYRYATLRRLQKRQEYDRNAATEGKNGRTTTRPVLVADHEWPAYLVRHQEWVTHLRVVHMEKMSDNFLKGRMAEIGCTYHSLQAHGPSRRGHAQLAFYELAPEMTVPRNTESE